MKQDLCQGTRDEVGPLRETCSRHARGGLVVQ